MCIADRQLDPKTRRLMVIANLSFILAILLRNSERWHWFHPSSQIERNYLDGVCGLLLGISIGINLFVLRHCSRCGQKENEQSI
jgi:hypothetical protein